MSAVYKVVRKPFHTRSSQLKHPLSSDSAILCGMTILCMTCALVSDVTQPPELINISAFVSDGTLKSVLSIRSKYPRSHIILLHVMSTVGPTIWLFLYSRVLFQKPMRPQLVKFPALYDTRRFIKADSHIPCRSHAVPLPFPCRSPAVPMLFPCRSPTMPFCYGFRLCLSHLIYIVRPCLWIKWERHNLKP
jgi:hypothetical protein